MCRFKSVLSNQRSLIFENALAGVAGTCAALTASLMALGFVLGR